MSTCEWMCEGIGIRTNELYPYLNQTKCVDVLKEELGDDFKFDTKSTFNIDDYFPEPFESLAELLCHCDGTKTLTFDYNNNGEYYFYYTPKYPWDMREGEPLSIADVHERICKAVFCLCDISKEQLESMIDNDIYDYGCG